MEKPSPTLTPLTPIVAPIAVGAVDCETCAVGCSGSFHAVEFCPLITRDYPTGAALATMGDPTERVWFVKSGVVAGTWGRGRETNVLYPAGSFVGLEALVSDVRVVSAWTLARTSVCTITRDAFEQWLKRRGDLSEQLRKTAIELVAAAELNARSES